MLLSRSVVVVPRGAALDARPTLGWVNITAAHVRQIDHHAAFGDGLSGNVVPSTSSRDLESRSPGEAHRISDIGGIDAPGDERWALVDETVVNGAHLVVAGIVGPDDLSGELLTERVH
jgi:hypothetical protein